MIWNIFWFLIEYWFITAWVLAVVGTWVFFGKKLALVVATAGVGHILYTMGRKHEKDHLETHYREVAEEREKAYAEIDGRNTDRSDVDNRLRDRTY